MNTAKFKNRHLRSILDIFLFQCVTAATGKQKICMIDILFFIKTSHLQI
jgi:hypothetical protein